MSEDTRKFIPDNISLGTQLFFLAQTQIHAREYQAAHSSIEECLATHFIDKKHNSFIIYFALAKLLQCEGRHAEAIAVFNKAIDLTDSAVPHCFFRRAWSYKVGNNTVLCAHPVHSSDALLC